MITRLLHKSQAQHWKPRTDTACATGGSSLQRTKAPAEQEQQERHTEREVLWTRLSGFWSVNGGAAYVRLTGSRATDVRPCDIRNTPTVSERSVVDFKRSALVICDITALLRLMLRGDRCRGFSEAGDFCSHIFYCSTSQAGRTIVRRNANIRDADPPGALPFPTLGPAPKHLTGHALTPIFSKTEYTFVSPFVLHSLISSCRYFPHIHCFLF